MYRILGSGVHLESPYRSNCRSAANLVVSRRPSKGSSAQVAQIDHVDKLSWKSSPAMPSDTAGLSFCNSSITALQLLDNIRSTTEETPVLQFRCLGLLYGVASARSLSAFDPILHKEANTLQSAGELWRPGVP